MRHFSHSIITAILLLLAGCRPKNENIVILYENDVHCAIENYAKLAGLRDAIADTANVALVSSGDFLQGGTAGAISTGKYIVDLMKATGYDAVTLGNHEFDYNMPRMKALLDTLAVPVVCVNLRESKSNKHLYAPYTIKKFGKKKVAFIGATTPTTRTTEEYAFVDEEYNELYNLSPDSLIAQIQQAATSARNEGADFVVLLSHLGEEPTEFHSDSHHIIHSTTGIDVVLDGHSHSVIACDTVLNKAGVPVTISQTGTRLAYVGKLVITPNGKIHTQLIPTSEIKQESEAVKKVRHNIDVQSSGFTQKVVGTCEYMLLVRNDTEGKVARKRETNAGDFATDAIMEHCHTDMVMINAGGLRTNLPEGEVTIGSILDMAPYDNQLTIVEETGAKIVELLTACTQTLPKDDGDFPQVSGLKFDINGSKHTVSNVQVLNKTTKQYEPIDMQKTYTIGTLDYTVTGGGFRGLLRHSKVVKKDNKTLSDMISLYIQQTLNGNIGKTYAAPQGRINITY